MEELNMDEMLKNVTNFILSSNHVEKEELAYVLKYSYDYYKQNLNESDEKLDDINKYYKYISTDIERFALLISVFETFVLPPLYLKSVIEQKEEIDELKIIQFEDFDSEVFYDRPFNNLLTTSEFQNLGILLFGKLFSLSDFY